MSSSPAFYKELADAIYHSDNSLLASSNDHNFDEKKVTLTKDTFIEGKRFPANTTLNIKKPVSAY